MMFVGLRRLPVLFLCLLAWGQSGRAGEAGFPALKDDLDSDSLRHAIERSLQYLDKLPPDRVVGEWPRKVTAGEIKDTLVLFSSKLDLFGRPETLKNVIRSNFDLHEARGSDGAGDMLVTGYYRPILKGSLTRTGEFPYPIYGKPKDLVEIETVTLRPQFEAEKSIGRLNGEQLVPYYSRREIDAMGRLKNKGYEIAWAEDPIDVFFLHVQGSGILRLRDGRMLSLGYAGSNGRSYRSIGRVLVDRGKMAAEEVTMQRLRQYLREHPAERDEILAQNESYIFFRFLSEGPLGSLEVPLTPGRSIATDSRIFPKGALALLVSQKPVFDVQGRLVKWERFARFVLNQDTGSAIKGEGRVDLFFGAGELAGESAGVMKSSGRLFFFLGKERR
jgi:membrane-bound lytic murein transglycosylase A